LYHLAGSLRKVYFFAPGPCRTSLRSISEVLLRKTMLRTFFGLISGIFYGGSLKILNVKVFAPLFSKSG